MRTLPLPVLVLLANGVAHHAAARAAPREPAPAIPSLQLGCAPLSSDQLRRYLAVELSGVRFKHPRIRRLVIAIRCDQKRLKIRITDPGSGRTAARSFAFVVRGSGQERVVALAAAQLLSAALPRLLPRPSRRPAAGRAPPPRRPPPKRLPPRRRVRTWRAPVARPNSAPLEPRQRRRARRLPIWIGAAALVSLHDLSQPLVTFGGSLQARLVFSPSWSLVFSADAAAGRVSRTGGAVEALVVGGEVGVRWSWLRYDRFALSSSLRVGACYLRLRGVPESTHRGQTAHGASGRASLSIGPSWRVGRLRLGAEVTVAALLPGMVGRIGNDSDVRLKDALVGFTLRVEILVRKKR